jgi:hypothetical protein
MRSVYGLLAPTKDTGMGTGGKAVWASADVIRGCDVLFCGNFGQAKWKCCFVRH